MTDLKSSDSLRCKQEHGIILSDYSTLAQTKYMARDIALDPRDVRGFLDHEEGLALMQAVAAVSDKGPCLEIGSYCGKSTLYLGKACLDTGATLFAIDHHRGSEEHQRGEQYHDPNLYDPQTQSMDSFAEFRRNIRAAQLEQVVAPIVAPSAVVARHWRTPLALVFIDGGHSEQDAQADYQNWQAHIVDGGILAIHDIFETPELGGQAPYHIMQRALRSKTFVRWKRVKSLALLRCRRQ